MGYGIYLQLLDDIQDIKEDVEGETNTMCAFLKQQNLAELEGEYDELKIKYDKLFKPARTTKDKYIVELRYSRQGGSDGFLTKRPEDTAFRWLSLADAQSLLAESSQSHCKDLYVKVVFPQGESLSHSKAWSLTQQLHRYDYYFRQDECP